MNDGRNRVLLAVVGVAFAVGAGLSACLGAGAFGTARADRDVFDPTVVRWWTEGGWESFATVVAIGGAAMAIGLWLAMPPLRRGDSRRRTASITFPRRRGDTTLRARALSRGLEADLGKIPDVRGATVGLFGAYPDIELRAVLEVGDDADLEQLPRRVDEVVDHLRDTTGARPARMQIAVRFTDTKRGRQLS